MNRRERVRLLFLIAAGLGLALSVQQSIHARKTRGPTAEELEDLSELHRLGVISDEELCDKQRNVIEG
jgi:hypothetical protein